VAFGVAEARTSQMILGRSGAEQLWGRGDMLFQMPSDRNPLQVQGYFASREELSHFLTV